MLKSKHIKCFGAWEAASEKAKEAHEIGKKAEKKSRERRGWTKTNVLVILPPRQADGTTAWIYNHGNLICGSYVNLFCVVWDFTRGQLDNRFVLVVSLLALDLCACITSTHVHMNDMLSRCCSLSFSHEIWTIKKTVLLCQWFISTGFNRESFNILCHSSINIWDHETSWIWGWWIPGHWQNQAEQIES